jgi:hypothetical protein
MVKKKVLSNRIIISSAENYVNKYTVFNFYNQRVIIFNNHKL